MNIISDKKKCFKLTTGFAPLFSNSFWKQRYIVWLQSGKIIFFFNTFTSVTKKQKIRLKIDYETMIYLIRAVTAFILRIFHPVFPECSTNNFTEQKNFN